MSASHHVLLLRDESGAEHQKKVKAMQALIDADVQPPDELLKYFGIHERFEFEPESSGLVAGDERHGAVKSWRAEMEEGFEIDLRKLPPGVVRVRVYTSY